MKTKRTINEVMTDLAARNPSYLFGLCIEKGLIAIAVDAHWHPVVSASITGDWVDVSGGLPLVNGERVYSDADFSALSVAE